VKLTKASFLLKETEESSIGYKLTPDKDPAIMSQTS